MEAEEIRHWAEIVALASAAVYFFWKAISGFMYVNLSLEMNHRRQPSNKPGTDYLVTTLKLRKGDNGTLRLHELSISVAPTVSDLQDEVHTFDLSVNADGRARNLNLSPGEQTEFSHCFEVPHDSCCRIISSVRGRSGLMFRAGRFAAWKTAGWSMPTWSLGEDDKVLGADSPKVHRRIK